MNSFPAIIREKGKKLITIGSILMCILLSSSFKVPDTGKRELLKQLGLSETVAEKYLWENLTQEYFSVPRIRAIKAMASGNRMKVAIDVLEFVRDYTSSEEFAATYARLREQHRPKNTLGATNTELIKSRRKNLEYGIKKLRDLEKKVCGEERKTYSHQITILQKELNKLNEPNPEAANWSNEFPASPELLIRRTLQRFLEDTKDVDFRAAVRTNKHDRKVFVNQEYEAKPAVWKLCYRAGRESTTIIRAMINQWINEIGAVNP